MQGTPRLPYDRAGGDRRVQQNRIQSLAWRLESKPFPARVLAERLEAAGAGPGNPRPGVTQEIRGHNRVGNAELGEEGFHARGKCLPGAVTREGLSL